MPGQQSAVCSKINNSPVRVVQIKEKFGGLRIYVEPWNQGVEDVIRAKVTKP